MSPTISFSVVIPAYNAAGYVGRALASIYAAFDRTTLEGLEVIVIDDGSDDALQLQQVCAGYPRVCLLHHERNRGMCAARNSGFSATKGDFVTLLDADDEFIPNWFEVLGDILKEWPKEANVCFTPCINDAGELACVKPGYRGWLTAQDLIMENLSGEYNPIFRGAYIRRLGYEDLGTKKSCGLLTYLRMAREAPFWVTDKAQRHYHDAVSHGVTSGWTRPDKALESYKCFSAVLYEQGDFIRGVSDAMHRQLICKSLIYRMLARCGRDFVTLARVFSFNALKPCMATLILLLIGPTFTAWLLGLAKRVRLLRRYG